MAQQTINLGTIADDGTGDTLRVGGDKINDNFTELYTADAALGTAAALDVDIDDTLAADSDSLIPTQQAVKAYVDAAVGGSGIDVEDEGVSEATGATTLNFVGAGVVATDMGGGVVDVTIAGGGSGIDVEDEGVSEATGVSTLNFTGSGVTATDMGGGVVDVTISGGGSFVLDDATDVDLTTTPPTSGDVLEFDGTDWVPAAPSGGGAELGGVAWTDLTFGSSSSTYGQTVYICNETFAMATGKRLEVEAYVYKVINTDSGIWIGNGSNGLNARSQSNNILNLYRRPSGGPDSSIGVSSTVVSNDYTGMQRLDFTAMCSGASSTGCRAMLDFLTQGSSELTSAFDFNGVTLTVALQTGDITKCVARARLIG